MNKDNRFKTRYITFNDSHIAPINGISPEELKDAAKIACTKYRDRSSLKKTTALNHLAKSLGFKGGFSGYKKSFENDLIPFMEKNHLKNRKDFFSNPSFTHIKPFDVAQKVFLDKSQKIERVFLGNGINRAKLETGLVKDQDRNVLTTQVIDEALKTVEKHLDSGEIWDYNHPINSAYNSIPHTAPKFPQDIIAQAALFNPSGEGDVNVYIKNHQGSLSQREYLYLKEIEIFKKWALFIPVGWVDIIRYNSNLIFLKESSGDYDILIKDAKDQPFEHNRHAPFLKNSDIPKADDNYHFERWKYFEYKGWMQMDKYLAHLEDDKNDRSEHDHIETIYKNFYIRKKLYKQPQKAAGLKSGFITIDLEDYKLNVSQLITIGEFRNFLNNGNPNYKKYRTELEKEDKVDSFEKANRESVELPASVTWYDANAYAAWLSKSQGLPVRLISEKEYNQVYKETTSPEKYFGWSNLMYFLDDLNIQPNDPRFVFTDDSIGINHEHFNITNMYGCPSVFDVLTDEEKSNLEIAYKKRDFIDYKPRTHKSGIEFVTHHNFGEWINKCGCAVNTKHLGAIDAPDYRSAESVAFAAHSTGQYKSCRIGFRLCYLHND